MMQTQKVCAVTGARGYLGGAVKAALAAQGWRVVELTRQPQPGEPNTVAFQLGAALAPVALRGVDVLVHCAYDFTALKWEQIREVNVLGTEKLLRAAQQAGVRQLVVISSISAFEGCHSLYGKAKLEIERRALAADALVLRPGLIYGDASGGMFGRLQAQVEKASLLPVFNGGRQIQYLIHEQDLCAAITRFIKNEFASPNHPITMAHEQPWEFRQILEALAKAKGKQLRFVSLPWRLVWLPLKMAETIGVRLNFRSDSLVSLMHQNPNPSFELRKQLGLKCRPF